MKVIFFFLITLLVSSCNTQNKDALKQVDEMQKKASELTEKFKLVDEKALSDAKKQYDESISLVKRYYFKDTIDKDFMNSLDYYRNIKSSYKTINNNKLVINDNLVIVNKQLKDLKTDLENNTIQGEKLTEALKNEYSNLSRLDSSLTLYTQNAELILFVHDSIANYVKNKTLSF